MADRSFMREKGDPLGQAAPTHIGDYRVIAKLAQGGMGELFVAVAANDPSGEQPCVVKRILPRVAHDQGLIR
jgi:serine/threonine-protein kinase